MKILAIEDFRVGNVIKRPWGYCYQRLSMVVYVGSVRTVAVPLIICFRQMGKITS